MARWATQTWGDQVHTFTAPVEAWAEPPLRVDLISLVGWAHAYSVEAREFVNMEATDGTTVGTWPDETGVADVAQATAGSRPTYRATLGPATQACLQFDGGDYLGPKAFVANLTSPVTHVIIAKLDTNSPGAQHYDDGDDATNRNFVVATNLPRYQINDDQTGAPAPDLDWHLLRAYSNGAATTMTEDSTTSLAMTVAGTYDMDGITVGANFLGNNKITGKIAFIGIYDGDVTADPGWAAWLAAVDSFYNLPPTVWPATLSAPLGSLTGTITATVVHPATLSAPLGGLTASITATVKHPATLAAPLGSLTATITATVKVPATLSAPLGSLTGTITATVKVPATMAAPLGALAGTITATVKVAATLAAPLGSLTGQITAGVKIPATLSAPLGSLTGAITATVKVPAAFAAPLGALAATLTATVRAPATLSAPLGALTASITATASAPASTLFTAALGVLVARMEAVLFPVEAGRTVASDGLGGRTVTGRSRVVAVEAAPGGTETVAVAARRPVTSAGVGRTVTAEEPP